MFLSLDDQKIKYTGRIDFADPKKPTFIFPSSSLAFRFYGKGLKICIRNHCDYYRSFIGVIIDGDVNKYEVNKEGITTITILQEEKEAEHDVIIYKVLDGCHIFMLEEVELLGKAKVLLVKQKETRRIEFYGDSISAGEITEAIEYKGKEDPEHDGQYSNSWYSYAWVCARKLKAEIHNISQGGIALLNNTGWYQEPNAIGMEEMWNSLYYSPKFGKRVKWDFSKFIPDVVVIAIGQNDSHPKDYMTEDYNSEKAKYWRKCYKEFVLNIKEKYPKTFIVLTTTPMIHSKKWDQAIEEICFQINDDAIRQFLYHNNGVGTPGHLRISESEEMANELATYIESTCFNKKSLPN